MSTAAACREAGRRLCINAGELCAARFSGIKKGPCILM